MNKLPEKPPEAWDEIAFQTIEKIHQDSAFVKVVTEYNSRYLAWDDLTYRIPDPEKRMTAWAVMKMLRAMRYEAVPFPPPLPQILDHPPRDLAQPPHLRPVPLGHPPGSQQDHQT
ncbi:hypothetical protein [Methanogenium cariaci]|uniref:hypothetical protein n=1 Tax=Methanogenium cariaci TaxID=2197 RepID=UPI001FE0ED4A|nr:hypothetical protein [Methanogenium cariaci]